MEDEIREIARQEASKIIAEKIASFNNQPEYVTTKEAREKYSLYGATMYRHINSGHLTLVKMGGKSFLRRSEIEKLFVPVTA